MSNGPQLRTERLLLRRWHTADEHPFAELNADPEVMAHFPNTLSRAESTALIERNEAMLEEHGYGLWAVELHATGELVGAVGLMAVDIDVEFAPGVEVGWRLARRFWGQGLAFEGARAALDYGFGELALSEIVAYTAARNARSRRLMERLGMSRDPAEDFLHPWLEPDDALAPHVLYRLRSPS